MTTIVDCINTYMIDIRKYNASFIKITGDFDDKIEISDFFTENAPKFWFSPKYKMGIWDGKIRFFNKATGLLPFGLIGKLMVCLQRYDIQASISPQLKKEIQNFENIPKFEELAFKGVDHNVYEKRDYQINGALEALKHKRGVLEHATGAGKTLTIFLIINYLLNLQKLSNIKIVIVVPTKGLIKQFYSDFVDYGMNPDLMGVYYGDVKDCSKTITIGTWQSLHKNKKFLRSVTCFFGDEAHGDKAVVVKELTENCVKADLRIGCTGSLPDEPCDRVTIEGVFGPVIDTIKSTKLIHEDKVLSEILIKHIQLFYPKKITSYLRGKDYKTEKKILQAYPKRKHIVKKIIEKNAKGENMLLLFDEKAFGKSYLEFLRLEFPDKIFYYVDGDIDVDTREEIRLKANEQSDVIILASLGTFSTGINLPKIHYIIFLWAGKSSIRVKQSIGRGLRKHHTKGKLILYDIADQLKYSKKHAIERLKIYMREQFPVQILSVGDKKNEE